MAKKKQPQKKKATPARKTRPATSKAAPKKKAASTKTKAPRAPTKTSKSKLLQTVATPPGFPIVAIGASAGGLEALESFFKAMPPDAGLGFVVVVHLDPKHVSLLPELLQKHTKMPVRQVEDGVTIERDHVYVIPPNKELAILRGKLQLLESTKSRSTSLPIDCFLRSLAQDQQGNATCIILSGTGSDGTLGLQAIKGEAGMVIAQDEESAAYEGMPRSAVATGLVDYVLPPAKMPEQLINYVRHATGARQKVASADNAVAQALHKILVILRSRTNHDFSLYKKNTICRRIERRMNVHQIDTVSDYVRYLQESEREAGVLFKELLIGVTNFFRDPEAFAVLQEKALQELMAVKPEDSALRAWIPGCASGEEAYSVAIVLHECMEKSGRHFHVQVFGTDLDEAAINTARTGLYPESITADVPPDRLKRFFTKEEDGQYRVKKMIREMLVFAPQDIIKDPPFTKLDLLCCRNLLIYLGAELQHRLLPIFHYSLRPDGILFLGSSETIGPATDLFALRDRKWKIYRRKPSGDAAPPALHFPAQRELGISAGPGKIEGVRRAEEVSERQLLATILEKSDMPPCAIVTDDAEVIYIHGRTGRFLEPAQGKATMNVVEMARPGLRKPLAGAIREVATQRQEVVCSGLQVKHNGGNLLLNLAVKPILEQLPLRGLMMVVFEETASRAKESKIPTASAKHPPKNSSTLEQNLQFTKESLQTTIEELETSNEELKSTNEELQSTNEELQSTNEELETSKEELQSLNEESVTVNAELQGRIDELSRANNDVKNLLDSTGIATIFLDCDLRIRRFTPKATEIIPLAATDTGRPIKHLASTLVDADLEECGREVLADLAVQEREVESKDDRCYVMRVRPYRTTANAIDGVVVTFEDISERKQAEKSAAEARTFAESIVTTIRESLLILDGDLRVVSANRSFYRRFNVKPATTEGELVYDLGNGQWNIPALRELLESVLPESTTFDDYEVEHDFETIGRKKMLLNARQLKQEGTPKNLILLAIEDVTEEQ